MELNFEKCPLCGTEFSSIKFKEIESTLREEEQRKASELAAARLSTRRDLEEQFRLDLETQKKVAEKRGREEGEQELRKIAKERDLAAKKLKEAEAREATIRKQAEQEVQRQKLAAEKKAK